MQLYIQECEERYHRWFDIYENGCADPTWPDGVNLDLVRNHILGRKKAIKICCDELGIDYPDIYFRETPPKIDSDYMANPEQIIQDAEKTLSILKDNLNYKELLTFRNKLSQKQLESINYFSVVGGVINLEKHIKTSNYVSMRNNSRRYLWTIESFAQCLERARSIQPAEKIQMTLFDL